MFTKSKWVGLAMISALLLPVYGWAETTELTIVIKNHRFEPAREGCPLKDVYRNTQDNNQCRDDTGNLPIPQ